MPSEDFTFSHRTIDSWQLPVQAARLFEVENYLQEKMMILPRTQAAWAEMQQ